MKWNFKVWFRSDPSNRNQVTKLVPSAPNRRSSDGVPLQRRHPSSYTAKNSNGLILSKNNDPLQAGRYYISDEYNSVFKFSNLHVIWWKNLRFIWSYYENCIYSSLLCFFRKLEWFISNKFHWKKWKMFDHQHQNLWIWQKYSGCSYFFFWHMSVIGKNKIFSVILSYHPLQETQWIQFKMICYWKMTFTQCLTTTFFQSIQMYDQIIIYLFNYDRLIIEDCFKTIIKLFDFKVTFLNLLANFSIKIFWSKTIDQRITCYDGISNKLFWQTWEMMKSLFWNLTFSHAPTWWDKSLMDQKALKN